MGKKRTLLHDILWDKFDKKTPEAEKTKTKQEYAAL